MSRSRSAFRRWRATILLASMLVAACSTADGPAPRPVGGTTPPDSSRRCDPLPAPAGPPPVFPVEVFLPPGTFLVEHTPPLGPYERAVVAVPLELRPFVDLLRAEWSREGWEVGPGELEGNDAEQSFYRGQDRAIVLVTASFCDRGHVRVALAVGTQPGTGAEAGGP